MKPKLGLTIATMAMIAASAFAADVKSGLQVGESTSAFDVVDITGPNKGKQLCYV
jgi:hypothetical protein